MEPILVPTTDVNSETAVIVEWRFPDGATDADQAGSVSGPGAVASMLL